MVTYLKQIPGARSFAPLFLLLLFNLTLSGCAAPVKLPAPPVMLIINDDSPASVQVGAYYASKRHIPNSQICHIHCPVTEEIDEDTFSADILLPVAEQLGQPDMQSRIDYLVLTKGVPLRIRSTQTSANPKFTPNGDSVDGRLMTQDVPGLSSPSRNPFYNSAVRFSHKATGLYLATRLDGYTVADAERLVDNSLLARPAPGVFLLDACPSRTDGGKGSILDLAPLNDTLAAAAKTLQTRGLTVTLDQTTAFIAHAPPLMGYWSWGSNDPAFDITAYKAFKFRPGALAETAVSTSARTLLPTVGGQSLIADLVADNVTGVKGYVAEPYTFSMARADILFDRYTKGWDLAESFYAASPVLHWKDIVLGDPLCAPYATAVKAR